MYVYDGWTNTQLPIFPFQVQKAYEQKIKRLVLSDSNGWGTGVYSLASLLFTM